MDSVYLSTFIPLKEFKVLKRPDRWRITIYGDYYQSLQEILKDEKNVQLCIRLYFLLYCCNLLKYFHVEQKILTNVLGYSKRISVTKATHILESHNLIRVEKIFKRNNKIYDHPFNEYHTLSFTVNKSSLTKNIIIDIPLIDSFKSLFKKPINNLLSNYYTTHTTDTIFDLTDSDIRSWNQNKESYYPEDLYVQRMLWRYTEIKAPTAGYLNTKLSMLPTYNEEEGRFYHWFHNVPKSPKDESTPARESYTYEDECLWEKWDLHNAYFVYLYILCCRLLRENRYDSELNRFKDLVLSGVMYDKITNYVNSFHPYCVFANRDKVKEQLQKYLGYINESMLKNRLCDTIILEIDDYFQKYFPNIRNVIINYSYRYEVNKEKPTVTVHRNGKTFERKNMKRIKNMHRDIAKFEIPLIVKGICRKLESKYGVKPVTVHDAIYMKVSDCRKVSDLEIDALLRETVDELCWSELIK